MKNMNRDSLQLLSVVREICYSSCKVSVKQITDLVRGKACKSAYLRKDVADRLSGCMRHLSEHELRRLIIKLLIFGVLEEEFVAVRCPGRNNNIVVHLIEGKATRI